MITVSGTNVYTGVYSDSVTITRATYDGGDSPIHYVSTGGGGVWPYTNWTDAATNIQDAVDAAAPGDKVHVASGNYHENVNLRETIELVGSFGPGNTTIDGESSGSCIAVWTNASVIRDIRMICGSGTLDADWQAPAGGGIYFSAGCASRVISCEMSYNYASGGGGVFSAGDATNNILEDCLIRYNSADAGGGVCGCTLRECRIEFNEAGTFFGDGGGCRESVATDCLIKGNQSGLGAGSWGGTLTRCVVSDNTASSEGGGSWNSKLYNCLVLRNGGSSGAIGQYSDMRGCTVVENSGSSWCYGYSTFKNCIVYGNFGDLSHGSFQYSCAPGLSGDGTISEDPMFVNSGAGDYRLQAGSPCIDAGNNAYVVGETDLDAVRRVDVSIVDMGAYEYQWSFDITASCGPNGSIEPPGASGIPGGGSASFAVTPSNYYHIVDVSTNGVSLGTVTGVVWSSVTANGVISATFEANLAIYGTPQWWLAQYGWTNDLDAAALADQDGDGLASWREYDLGLAGNNPDTDGDGLKDGGELAAGTDPLGSDSNVVNQVLANSGDFGLYTSNSIMDLSMGQLMLRTSNGWMRMSLQMEQCTNLSEGRWTNAGDAVIWQIEAPGQKAFYRVRGR